MEWEDGRWLNQIRFDHEDWAREFETRHVISTTFFESNFTSVNVHESPHFQRVIT